MKKNGIHYCVCQFFFVILQPNYVRECANARTYTYNRNKKYTKIQWKNKKSMMDRVFKCSRD